MDLKLAGKTALITSASLLDAHQRPRKSGRQSHLWHRNIQVHEWRSDRNRRRNLVSIVQFLKTEK
jgi:hypothetical protein